MKKIISFLFIVIMCLTLSSCLTASAVSYDDEVYNDNVNINVLITYGTPHYSSDGVLIYYFYRNMYYYPYYNKGIYHFRRYHKSLLPHKIHKPIPRDFHHKQPTFNRQHPRIPNIHRNTNNFNVNRNKQINVPRNNNGTNRGGRGKR